jgi:hypothetical protein
VKIHTKGKLVSGEGTEKSKTADIKADDVINFLQLIQA